MAKQCIYIHDLGISEKFCISSDLSAILAEFVFSVIPVMCPNFADRLAGNAEFSKNSQILDN